jgi:hypothetical protein
MMARSLFHSVTIYKDYTFSIEKEISDSRIPLISINSSPSCMPARAAGLLSTQDKTTCNVNQKEIIPVLEHMKSNGIKENISFV